MALHSAEAVTVTAVSMDVLVQREMESDVLR
jgi:hypothetical protein